MVHYMCKCVYKFRISTTVDNIASNLNSALTELKTLNPDYQELYFTIHVDLYKLRPIDTTYALNVYLLIDSEDSPAFEILDKEIKDELFKRVIGSVYI